MAAKHQIQASRTSPRYRQHQGSFRVAVVETQSPHHREQPERESRADTYSGPRCDLLTLNYENQVPTCPIVSVCDFAVGLTRTICPASLAKYRSTYSFNFSNCFALPSRTGSSDQRPSRLNRAS